MRTCRVILILAMWPIAPVLFVAFAFRQGAAYVWLFTNVASNRVPR